MPRLTALLGLLAVFSTALLADTEIIVTASRVEEDARSAPAYVRVIPEEDIRRGDTVLDALRNLPDISIKESSPGKEYISMGGFGENGFARTLILIDGRPINRPDMAGINWRTIPLDRVERIEVVKGALSSQYGDQAVAGAVNIIMKEPEGLEAWARTSLSTGLTNRQAAGLAWADESFRTEIGVSREDLRPSRDRSDSRILSTDLALGGTFGSVDVDMTGEFSDADYELPSGLTKVQYDNDPDQAVPQTDEVSERRYGTGLTLAWSPGSTDILIPISWKRLDSNVNIDSWFSWNDVILDDIRSSVQGSFTTMIGNTVGLTSTTGVDIGYSQINVKIYSERARVNLTDDNTPNRLDLGAWTRIDALVGGDWTIDGGMRASYYEVSMGIDSTAMSPFVYDLGLSWSPSDIWKTSLRYGRVFRYPALDEQASYNGFGAASLNEDLKPEYGHHVTVSAEYARGPFTGALSPYFLAMNDEIGWDGSKNANIGDTYHYGGVLSAAWNVDSGEIRASYSLDRAQFADTGKFIPLVTEHTVTAGASVRPWAFLDISSDVEYRSGFFEGGDSANALDKVPGRTTWNARIDWNPLDELEVYARIQNILDDRTPSFVYYSSWYPSAGRTLDFGASWSY